MSSASILGVIVGKIRHRKKSYPIFLLKIDKNSEINFYYTILSLSLEVYLQVKCGGELLVNAQKIA